MINSSPAPIKTIAGPSEGQTGAFLIARSFRIAVKALFSPVDGPDAPGRGIYLPAGESRSERAAGAGKRMQDGGDGWRDAQRAFAGGRRSGNSSICRHRQNAGSSRLEHPPPCAEGDRQ
nr:MAG TPA: hypothetical protein [Caudoviricetes sp.]